jgi:hypothetical protein
MTSPKPLDEHRSIERFHRALRTEFRTDRAFKDAKLLHEFPMPEVELIGNFDRDQLVALGAVADVSAGSTDTKTPTSCSERQRQEVRRGDNSGNEDQGDQAHPSSSRPAGLTDGPDPVRGVTPSRLHKISDRPRPASWMAWSPEVGATASRHDPSLI